MKLNSLFSVVCVSSALILSPVLVSAIDIKSQKTPTIAKQLITAQQETPKTKPDQQVGDEDINRFTNTIVLIKDFYVQSVGDKTLLDDAIRGMVAGLDPHSEYLDSDAYKTLLMTTAGEFGGVGIEITPEYGILKIVAPMDDTPAAKAG